MTDNNVTHDQRNENDILSQMRNLGLDPEAILNQEQRRQADLRRLTGSTIHRLWQCLEECVPCWGIKLNSGDIEIFVCPTAILPEEDEDLIEGAEDVAFAIENVIAQQGFGVTTRERDSWTVGRIDRIVIHQTGAVTKDNLSRLYSDLVRLDQLLTSTKDPEPNIYLSYEARRY